MIRTLAQQKTVDRLRSANPSCVVRVLPRGASQPRVAVKVTGVNGAQVRIVHLDGSHTHGRFISRPAQARQAA